MPVVADKASCCNCRYRFKDGEWKERGLGDSKLLKHRVRITREIQHVEDFHVWHRDAARERDKL